MYKNIHVSEETMQQLKPSWTMHTKMDKTKSHSIWQISKYKLFKYPKSLHMGPRPQYSEQKNKKTVRTRCRPKARRVLQTAVSLHLLLLLMLHRSERPKEDRDQCHYYETSVGQRHSFGSWRRLSCAVGRRGDIFHDIFYDWGNRVFAYICHVSQSFADCHSLLWLTGLGHTSTLFT